MFNACTGLSELLTAHPDLADPQVTGSQCRKDIGEKKKLRRWSRGHQFIIRAGGHIETWQPLYKYVPNYAHWVCILYRCIFIYIYT